MNPQLEPKGPIVLGIESEVFERDEPGPNRYGARVMLMAGGAIVCGEETSEPLSLEGAETARASMFDRMVAAVGRTVSWAEGITKAPSQ